MQKQSYTFKLQDNWKQYLQNHGFCVLQNIITQEDVQIAKNLFWDWMESMQSGIQRNNMLTWNNASWPGVPDMGYFGSYGGAHSNSSWFIRTRPKVKECFQKIWQTNQLITSFDQFIAWRPWWLNDNEKESWYPFVQNIHLDQNIYRKKGLHCVQGMIPLIQVNDTTGGLKVVPNVNNQKQINKIIQRYPGLKGSNSDWLQLNVNDPYCQKAQLLYANPGDIILWDSRTIHGGHIGTGKTEQDYSNKLVRLSMTVTMTPKKWAKPGVLQKRKEAFKKRKCLTHWPHQYHQHGIFNFAPNIKKDKINLIQLKMNKQIEELIG